MVVDSFDALKSDEKAHAHGTAVAGAIVAHAKLMGAAPEARILAARAFGMQKANIEATTYSISESLDWAMERGARIINMSFTGPRDPTLEEKVGQARQKGIVLIAAAGNGGPTAPKAYPAAYEKVIAVTATDAEDKLFKGANRGGYIAVAAPGVDLLLPAPEVGYQVTTGTSFAAAEVSGIVALMLERKPDLTPDGVRKALTATARDLGPKGVDTQFGAGLVDAYLAIRSLEPAVATTGAKVNPASGRVIDGSCCYFSARAGWGQRPLEQSKNFRGSIEPVEPFAGIPRLTLKQANLAGSLTPDSQPRSALTPPRSPAPINATRPDFPVRAGQFFWPVSKAAHRHCDSFATPKLNAARRDSATLASGAGEL